MRPSSLGVGAASVLRFRRLIVEQYQRRRSRRRFPKCAGRHRLTRYFARLFRSSSASIVVIVGRSGTKLSTSIPSAFVARSARSHAAELPREPGPPFFASSIAFFRSIPIATSSRRCFATPGPSLPQAR